MALPSVLQEVWILYAIAVAIILLRYVVRLRTVGARGLFWDDLTCIGVLAFNTLDASLVHSVHYIGENSEVTEDSLKTLTSSDIKRLEYGSKLEYAAWWSYPALIWCMKFTMLFFYKRLTFGSAHNRVIKYLFWFTGVCYLGVVLTLVFGCFPTQMNWQVSPVPPWKCAFRRQNFLSVAVLNIITDAAILMVPVPMLWQLRVPLKKKLVIGLLLSSGVFVIVAAIIRVVLSLDAAPSASNINRWGVRETFIGIFTINLPILRPLFNKAFWVWGPYDPSSAGTESSYGRSSGRKSWRGTKLTDKSTDIVEYELDDYVRSPNSTGLPDDADIASNSSQEEFVSHRSNIITPDDRIVMETSYAVMSQARDAETGLALTGRTWNTISAPKSGP